MRILQVAARDFISTYGGGLVYVRNVVDCILGMGLDVSILSFGGINNTIAEAIIDNELDKAVTT